MNAQRLLAIFSKIGEDPDRVQQLRKIAVALAVSGKLRSGGGELGPADLWEAVEKLKRDLMERGALPKQKRYPEVSEEHLPQGFRDPARFAPLGSIARIEKGLTGIQQAQPGPFPMVVTAAERTPCDHYDFEGAAAIVPLVSSTGHGKASLHRLHYQEGKFALGTILAAIYPHDPNLISARFLFEYLSAFKEELLVSRMIGTANVTLSVGKIAEVPVPLICPKVQKKVDELMALCDRLEEGRGKREALRDRLTAASLARLTTPGTDAETFETHARFALQSLPALTTRPDQIKTLRQTILNLAVRGKLVEQDPADEPASELLRRIARERASKAAKAKTRTKRPITLAGEDLAANLPNVWGVEALGNLVDPTATISYGVLVPGPDVEDGVPFVRAQDLSLSDHPLRPNKTISPEVEAPYARTRLRGGEILLCVVGSIGKLGVVPPTWAGANIARAVARIAPVGAISPAYLLLAMRSEQIQTYFTEATRTLAQPTLNVGLIEALPVPLPPLAEQYRIVAKVDELMALCDRLEASLAAADTTRRRLLEALLHEAVAPAAEALEAAE